LQIAGPAQAVRLPKRTVDLTIKSVGKLQSGGPTRGRFHLREEWMKHCFLQSYAPGQASHAIVQSKKALRSSVRPKRLCPE
jgi:hypothetical protein